MSRKSSSADLKALRKLLAGLPRSTRVSLWVLVVVVAVSAVALPWMMSVLDDQEAQLRRLRAETNLALAEGAQMRRDHDYVVDNQGRYEDALARGLLEPQDRLAAQQILDGVLDDHYLVRLTHELAPVRLEPAGQGYEAVITPVRLEIGAMLDRDVFTVLRDAEDLLPGAVVVRGFRLMRQQPVTPTTLDRLRTGSPVAFIGATIDLEWRTARSTDGGAR